MQANSAFKAIFCHKVELIHVWLLPLHNTRSSNLCNMSFDNLDFLKVSLDGEHNKSKVLWGWQLLCLFDNVSKPAGRHIWGVISLNLKQMENGSTSHREINTIVTAQWNEQILPSHPQQHCYFQQAQQPCAHQHQYLQRVGLQLTISIQNITNGVLKWMAAPMITIIQFVHICTSNVVNSLQCIS